MKTKDIIAKYMKDNDCSRATAFRHLAKSRQSHDESQKSISNDDTKIKKSHETIDTNETKELRLLVRQLATDNETLRLEIKELKSLVIAGFEAISNNKPFETKVETNSETSLETSFACFSSLEDSNTTKDSIVIRDSKKEIKKKKSETETVDTKKRKPRETAEEKTNREQALQYLIANYPENVHDLDEDKCRKHFSKLTKEEIQEALDVLPLYNKKTEITQYPYKLSNFIREKKWKEKAKWEEVVSNKKTSKEGLKKTTAEYLNEYHMETIGRLNGTIKRPSDMGLWE